MKRARRFNLILDDVSITHVAFSPEFTHAVEGESNLSRTRYSALKTLLYFRLAKQVAQQIAQRAAFLVDQAIQEKVRATGYSFKDLQPNPVPSSSNLSSFEPREKLDPRN